MQLFWEEAIKSEIDSLVSNKIWELTDLPKSCKSISSKCIFKKKLRADGSIDKYKARLVIRGFDQEKRDRLFWHLLPCNQNSHH